MQTNVRKKKMYVTKGMNKNCLETTAINFAKCRSKPDC